MGNPRIEPSTHHLSIFRQAKEGWKVVITKARNWDESREGWNDGDSLSISRPGIWWSGGETYLKRRSLSKCSAWTWSSVIRILYSAFSFITETARLTQISLLDFRARIINWWCLSIAKYLVRLYCYLIQEITRLTSNSDFWFTRKMLDVLIIKLMFSLLNCMCNLPMIIYTKPRISNNSPTVPKYVHFCSD